MTYPAPPVPADADLRPLPFMPLHVAKLRDSDLAAECEPEACWYAVLLWCASWHQLPAGSLPDNDTVLCKLIGLGRDLKTFRTHREQAMRGWYKCSDGRFYHPVVAHEVIKSWRGRMEQAWRTECARIKKANQRNSTDDPCPTLEEFLAGRAPETRAALSQGTLDFVPEDTGKSPEGHEDLSSGTLPVVPRENPSKGERQGERERQGQGINTNDDEARPPEPAAPPPSDDVEEKGDLMRIAVRISRAGATNLNPAWPKPFARELDLVKSWIDEGIDLEGTILPTVEKMLERSDETSIGSLKFYDGAIRKAHALAERKAGKGTTKPVEPKPPIPVKDMDDPRIAIIREKLKANLNGGYSAWLAPEHTAMAIEDDLLRLKTRSPFNAEWIEGNYRHELEAVARTVFACAMVRVQPI